MKRTKTANVATSKFRKIGQMIVSAINTPIAQMLIEYGFDILEFIRLILAQ